MLWSDGDNSTEWTLPCRCHHTQVHAALAERVGVSTRYTELPGVGHIPMEEAAEGTVAAVREWLLDDWAAHVR